MFELDCMNTFSDNGLKPPFSVILWPIEGQNLANVAKNHIKSEHSPDKYTHQFEVDCMTTLSDNGRQPPFSVVLWPLDCQNLAVAKKHINSEHSPNKCTHQVWIGLHEYFFR